MKNRVPILAIFDPPPPRRQAPREKAPAIEQRTAGMKTPPIQTYSIKSMTDYGALPLSIERRKQLHQEELLEKAAHDKEMKEISSYMAQFENGPATAPGVLSGGQFLTDPKITAAVQDFDRRIAQEKRELEAAVDNILPNANGATAPIKTYHN